MMLGAIAVNFAELPTDYQQAMLDTRAMARLSACKRRHVGCILMTLDGLISRGAPNGNHLGGVVEGCTGPVEPGRCECLHAEVRALLLRPYVSVRPTVAFVTCAPCMNCLKALLDAGIQKIYFEEDSEPGTAALAYLISVNISRAKVLALAYQVVTDASANRALHDEELAVA